MRGSGAVRDATVAVLDHGVRIGSAVLVDGRHLLTADHVVHRRQAGQRIVRDHLEVCFPSGRAASHTLSVSPVVLDSASSRTWRSCTSTSRPAAYQRRPPSAQDGAPAVGEGARVPGRGA